MGTHLTEAPPRATHRLRATHPLRATWLALIAAVYTLLTISPALRVASPLERVVFAPAAWAMQLLWLRLSHLDPALFPLFAAGQLLGIGLLIDSPRLLRRLRASRARGESLGDPLRPWKATLLIAAVGVGWAYSAERQGERRFFHFDTQLQADAARERAGQFASLLDEAQHGAGDARRVVVIGDSMLEAALGRDRLVERGIRNGSGRPVELTRLTAGGLELVEVRPSLERILALEPSLVVLDANLFFSKVGHAFLLRDYGRPARWANAALDRLDAGTRRLGLSVRETAQYAPAELPAHVGENRSPDEQQVLDRWEGRQASVHDPNYVDATELLDELARRGVPACITTVPVSERLRPHVDEFLSESRALTRELARRASVPLLDSELYAPDAWFVDGVHMNGAGTLEYTEWFVEHLPPIAD